MKQILLSTNYRKELLFLCSTSDDLFDFPSTINPIDVLKAPSIVLSQTVYDVK